MKRLWQRLNSIRETIEADRKKEIEDRQQEEIERLKKMKANLGKS